MGSERKGGEVERVGRNGEELVSMPAAKRRRWTAARKKEVVLEGLKGKTTVAALCRREGITQSTYYEWREAALAKMEEALAYGGRTREEYQKDKEIERLQRKVGRQAMEIDILKKVEAIERRQGRQSRS